MSALASARRIAPAKLREVRTALTPSPHLQRRLGVVAAVLALVASLYLLWLRDSGLVAVEKVEVTGLTGKDAERARAALDGAARGMTTLHVDHDALQAAVEVFPVVEDIRVETDFPSGMRIEVIEHSPVAVLVSGEARIPVAGDGSVLAGLPTEGPLPEIRTDSRVPDRELGPGVALDSARLAGAAPGALLGRLEEVEHEDERGLVATVKDGPELVFGGADRLAAKWAAATRVLADPDAAGATYVDVRLPERPAAGGLTVETMAPVAPAGEEVVPAVPEVLPADPDLGAEPLPVAPEPVPEAAPVPEPPAPEPPAEEYAPAEPVDPGGGAVAEPQP